MLHVTTYSWYLKFSLYINTGETIMLRLVLTLQEQSYNIFLQNVIDHFTRSFNEFKCLKKQARYLWLNIFFMCFFLLFSIRLDVTTKTDIYYFFWNQVEIAMNSEISIFDLFLCMNQSEYNVFDLKKIQTKLNFRQLISFYVQI